MTVLVPLERKDEIEKAVIEHTNGTARLEWGDEIIYGYDTVNHVIKEDI
jgi:hypothetical protein